MAWQLPAKAVENRYDSTENWEAVNEPFKEHLLKRDKQPRGLVWCLVLVLGCAVALMATLMEQVLERASAAELHNGLHSLYSTIDSKPLGILVVVLAYTAVAAILLVLSVLWIRYLGRGSAGRSMPSVVAALNGIHQRHLGKWRFLVAKAVTTVAAVTSGLPVGHYGVLVEIGAMLGSGATSRSLTRLPFFQHFRNPRDRTLFLSIGLASGAAAAFSSPIGGLMLMLELQTSKFPVKFAYYVFCACVLCSLTLHVLRSYFSGFAFRDRQGMEFGELIPTHSFELVPLNYGFLAPCIIVSVVAALFSLLFSQIHLFFVRSQWSGSAKVVLLLSVMYLAGTVIISYLFGGRGCRVVAPSTLRSGRTVLFCEDKDSTNVFATLSMTYSDSAFRFLLLSGVEQVLTLPVLGVFVVWFAAGAAFFTSTIGVLNGDVLLPGAAIGAAIGRLIHVLALEIVEVPPWFDGSLCALIGAVSFLSTLTRLTYSLAFLFLDFGGDVRHVLFLMVAVGVGRGIGDLVGHDSIDTSVLRQHGYPVLDAADDAVKHDSVMTLHMLENRALELISTEVTVSEVAQRCAMTTHKCFPVVDPQGRYVGMLLKEVAELVLWRLSPLIPERFRLGIHLSASAARSDEFELLRDLEQFRHANRRSLPTLLEALSAVSVETMTLPFGPLRYVDASVPSLRIASCPSRAYFIFSSLGLRRAVVVDYENKPRGVITRADLTRSAFTVRPLQTIPLTGNENYVTRYRRPLFLPQG